MQRVLHHCDKHKIFKNLLSVFKLNACLFLFWTWLLFVPWIPSKIPEFSGQILVIIFIWLDVKSAGEYHGLWYLKLSSWKIEPKKSMISFSNQNKTLEWTKTFAFLWEEIFYNFDKMSSSYFRSYGKTWLKWLGYSWGHSRWK